MIATDRLRADLDRAAAGTPVAAPDIPALIGGGRRRRRRRRALLAGAAAVAVVAVLAGAGALATGTRHSGLPQRPAASPTGPSPTSTYRPPLTAVPRPPDSLVRVDGFDVAAWPAQGVVYDRTHHRYRYFPNTYAVPAPVGTRILLMSPGAAGNTKSISMYDTATGTSRPVQVDPTGLIEPVWSPDGSKLVLVSHSFTPGTSDTGKPVRFVVVDAATLASRVVTLPVGELPGSTLDMEWTPDSAHLVAGVGPTESRDGTGYLQLFTPDGTPDGRLPGSFNVPTVSAWSPDGSRYIALSDAPGADIRYAVVDAKSGTVLAHLPVEDGEFWWLDGRHLVYYSVVHPTEVSEVDTAGRAVRDYPVPRLSTGLVPHVVLFPHR
jgi:hypothetical protein